MEVEGGSSMPTILKHKYQLKIVHYIRQINVIILKRKISEALPLKVSNRLTNLVNLQSTYKKERERRKRKREGVWGVPSLSTLLKRKCHLKIEH